MKLFTIKQATECCLFIMFFLTSNGQVNMVRDPSFEDTTTCIDNLTYPNFLHSWKNLDSTRYSALPFYLFHTCSQSMFGLPNNSWCYQYPRSGNSVAVITPLYPSNPTWHRTYTRNKLKSGLIFGKSYCVKMFVSAFDKQGDYFTDGMQMYFDNGQLDTIVAIDSIGPFTFVIPQISNPTGHLLKDTLDWELISGILIASGVETYLTIGNFKSDANTDTLRTPFSTNAIGGWSQLMIDDISVIQTDIASWLQDAYCVLGDSVYIGLPKYEVPDALWYDINMVYIAKGSGLYVTPTQHTTQYIQGIDVCSSIRYDTLTVTATPLGVNEYDTKNFWVEVYPNPTNTGFNLKSNCVENCKLNIIITSLTGQKVIERVCDILEGNCFVNTPLMSGTYLVSITKQSTNETVVRKLVIAN